MQNNHFKLSYIIVIILVGVLVFGLGFTSYSNREPISVYKVYVDGEVIGTVSSKEEFNNYINEKEKEVKDKYHVDKVYMPEGVTLKKVTTYDKNINTNEQVYNKIIKIKQFTIKGVVVTIDNEKVENYEKKHVYVLNKEIFDEAIINMIKSFVETEDYEAYMESTQKEIVDTGSIIQNIDIEEDIKYKKDYISIDKEIFTNSSELSKYLLYGTQKEQSTYTVKEGDTIETVAEANKLNVQEFLIANSKFKSANTLLYEGQTVNVGLINPLINIVVEINSVKDEEKAYPVKIEYDEKELQGIEYVKQHGEKGLYRVSYEYMYINGQLSDTKTLTSIELKPTVTQIIVKGDKEVPSVADLSYWAWPTETPYTITTYYGYRWGTMHAAIDISGPGHGSNLYAANNGTVVEAKSGCAVGYAGCNGRRGNYVVINHNIGNYYTVYMHMAAVNVKVGQVVSRGQKIGTMGNTGEVYPVPSSYNPYGGTHLHYATYRGYPTRGGVPFNPFNIH